MLLHTGVDEFRLQVVDADDGAAGGQLLRGLAADAVARAGDQRHAPEQILIHMVIPWRSHGLDQVPADLLGQRAAAERGVEPADFAQGVVQRHLPGEAHAAMQMDGLLQHEGGVARASPASTGGCRMRPVFVGREHAMDAGAGGFLQQLHPRQPVPDRLLGRQRPSELHAGRDMWRGRAIAPFGGADDEAGKQDPAVALQRGEGGGVKSRQHLGAVERSQDWGCSGSSAVSGLEGGARSSSAAPPGPSATRIQSQSATWLA